MAVPTFDQAEGRVRPRYARLGLLGLGMITVALTVLAALVVFRFPEEAGFILPMWFAAAAATAVVWRFDATWARILGVVVALALGTMMFWLAFGLMHPGSFLDFVPAVIFVLGLGLALFGNIAAIVQRRRQHLHAHATPAEWRVEQAAVAVVVVAVAVSGVMSVLARESVDEAEAAGATPMEMVDFVFEPAAVEVTGGGQLMVHNGDPFVHDVAVPAIDLDPVTVAPGSTVLVDVDAAPGTYVLYCTLHSNVNDASPDPEEQMVATLAVR
jgi:plastocyanin